tara:strand:- start:11675 stop:12073 length:399 start_codon:yes stop_codon:yes gene_type:complete
MTYQELVATDDLSESVPSKINSNFLARANLNGSAMTADFTVWADDATGSPKDIYFCASAGGNVTATLPDATTGDAAAGRVVTIFKVDAANDVIIDGNGSQTINGATTVTMSSQYNYRAVISDGTEWFTIANN